jgi:hypothetical protein
MGCTCSGRSRGVGWWQAVGTRQQHRAHHPCQPQRCGDNHKLLTGRSTGASEGGSLSTSYTMLGPDTIRPRAAGSCFAGAGLPAAAASAAAACMLNIVTYVAGSREASTGVGMSQDFGRVIHPCTAPVLRASVPLAPTFDCAGSWRPAIAHRRRLVISGEHTWFVLAYMYAQRRALCCSCITALSSDIIL